MYKSTSRNSQHHAVSRVVNSRANSGGVDPETAATDAELKRLELVEKKKDLEVKVGKLTLQIKIAKDRHWRGAIDQIDFKVFERMEQQRMNMVVEIRDIEKLLSKLKVQKRLDHRPDALAGAFMFLARQMLPEPVFNRIMIAAIHRSSSDKE